MKILIATDGSDFSRAAIEKCCQIIAEPEEAAIRIVSVHELVVPIDIYGASLAYVEELENATQIQADDTVAAAAAKIREYFPNSKIDITTQVSKGATDQTLIESAKDWKADLIIIGSHGRGFWGRMMLGSVSHSLVHHAPCSVLVVRKPKAGNE
jgi:nucleotide-binding universal stress UspA family protein